MASAVAFIQWRSYETGLGGKGLFSDEPQSFNSHQERLASLGPGDDLWLVSRCPEDQQYYFVGVLRVSRVAVNAPGSKAAEEYGSHAIIADRTRSHDLARRFPAEGLLRAFTFEPGRPIRYGASIGQSLQTVRLLSPTDSLLLETGLRCLRAGAKQPLDSPFGLWTKCDRQFADYFLRNWTERAQPLAFMLYDSPPLLPVGAPVFIHSDKNLRLIARFLGAQYVSGHKQTVDPDERIAERERIWTTYRAPTLAPPTKPDFDRFWEGQSGVRSIFLMDRLARVPKPPAFKVYGTALEWGYPSSVGHRYLSLSQCALLLRACGVGDEALAAAMGGL